MTKRKAITIEACIRCGGDAQKRPYLLAPTPEYTYRYRICAHCMERLGALLTDEEAMREYLAELFGRILEKTAAARAALDRTS